MASTIQELLREGEAYLRARRIDNPRLDVELLLAFVRGSDRLALFTAGNLPPDPEHIAQFRSLLEERGRRRPLAQILGYRDFYNARFRVSPAVLIPRPETEELVEAALKTLDEMSSGGSDSMAILDLCCGSGCIGLSLALERPSLRVDLADISPEALEITRENARTLLPGDMPDGDRIRIMRGDLFQALPDPSPRYQGILCNPPYIHPDEASALEPDVRDYEPSLALFHDNPGDLYASILKQSVQYLERDGFLYLELAPRWAAMVLEQGREFFKSAEIRRDLSGLERFLMARGPK